MLPSKTLHFLRAVALLFLAACPAARAATLLLAPVQDATVYEEASGGTANGGGEFLLAGRTNQASNSRRRSLIQFDLSSLPAGAVITSVSLQLHAQAVATADVELGLHLVTLAWTTAASNPAGNESSGVAALAGDTTWLKASAPGTAWTTPGGDHLATASASLTVGAAAGFLTWTSPQLAADAAGWLAAPATNHGWLLRGDDLVAQTAKRFESVDSATAAFRPLLTVEYSTVPEPAGAALAAAAAGLATLGRRRRSFAS